MYSVWQIAILVLLGLAGVDLFLSGSRACPITFVREMAHSWSLDEVQAVSVSLRALKTLQWPLSGEIFDHIPSKFLVDELPMAFVIEPGKVTSLIYRCTAPVRGKHRFGRLEIRLDSPLRLWRRRYWLEDGEHEVVHVYPNFRRVDQFALLATDHRLSQIGVLRRRRRGEGLEFHQLREYREGDSQRQIDWKASSRHGKLIAREYQDERNQQIVFLLDCGQRMATRDATSSSGNARHQGLTHFDHTLNAMLLLSYVALKQGDAVGLSTFAHARVRHFAPRRSAATMKLLLNAVYDLEPSDATSDFVTASQILLQRLRKRSLIVVLTNLRDEDDDTLALALRLLRPHHIVMIASLREPVLDALRSSPVATFDDALTLGATLQYQQGRDHAMFKLRSAGVPCIDVDAQDLPIALVNQYWSMKRSGLI